MGLFSILGGMFGFGGRSPADSGIPTNPSGPPPLTASGAPGSPDFRNDRIASDITNIPWKGPGELQNFTGETSEHRRAYRRIALEEPVVLSAIEGKVDAISSTEVSVIPADKSKPNDVLAASFCKWAVEESRDGWEGLLHDMLWGGFVDGWSVLEPTFMGAWHPQLGACTTIKHIRSLDTTWLRLQLTPYRGITGIVSLRRGLEIFDWQMCLIYSHRKVFGDPFGNSDIRPVYRDAHLIEDAYKMWYLALKQCGEPYVHGKYSNPNLKFELQDALDQLRASGHIVTPKEDEVALLNLASAASFQAFEAKVNKLRESIYLAVRGAYLPFLEGQGGNDAHGDTKVHKGSSDAKVDISGRTACRVVRQQLFKLLVGWNFPPGTGIPSVQLGGIDWMETKQGIDALAAFKQAGGQASAEWAHETFRIPPPKDARDVFGGAGGGMGTGGPGGPTPPIGGGTPPTGSESPPTTGGGAPSPEKPTAALPQPGNQPRPPALPPPKPVMLPKPAQGPATPAPAEPVAAPTPSPDDVHAAVDELLQELIHAA